MEKSTIKKTMFLLPSLLAVLLLAGCLNTVNTQENADKSMTPVSVDTKKVITDSILAKRVKVLNVYSQALPTGLMKVQVTLQSTRTGWWSWLIKGNEPYEIGYRFSWFNKSGMKVDTATSTWIPINIIPGDTFYISGVAPTPQSKDFLLKLRQLD